jgi:hypothetical protein
MKKRQRRLKHQQRRHHGLTTAGPSPHEDRERATDRSQQLRRRTETGAFGVMALAILLMGYFMTVPEMSRVQEGSSVEIRYDPDSPDFAIPADADPSTYYDELVVMLVLSLLFVGLGVRHWRRTSGKR